MTLETIKHHKCIQTQNIDDSGFDISLECWIQDNEQKSKSWTISFTSKGEIDFAVYINDIKFCPYCGEKLE